MHYDHEFAHKTAYNVNHYGSTILVGGQIAKAGIEILVTHDSLKRLQFARVHHPQISVYHPEYDINAILMSYFGNVPIIGIDRMVKKEMVKV